ncbi:MAG: sugar phosphate isomerase/epimerase [Planctomycetes bacterium]|nr:sugar phosphate isomerase/epimerase [Planctomycetota bacterium]
MTVRNERTRREFLASVGAVALAPALVSPCVRAGCRKQAVAFSPRIGVCTSVKNADLLRQSGADYIEAGVRSLLVPDQPQDEFAAHLDAARKCGLPILAANGFLPGKLKCVGPDANHAAVLEFAEAAFRRAKKVGIRTIVFGSSGARSIPDGCARDTAELQFVALLGKMAPLAAANDVIVAVEPLNRGETNFINTLPEGARLVSAVQHPNIRLVVDIFHMLRMEEPPQHIRDVAPYVSHVHIAEKDKRTPPGTAGDDFTGYFQALKDIGYSGPISIECGWKDLGKQLPVAIKTMRAQLAKVS